MSHTLLRASQRLGSRGQAVSVLAWGTQGLCLACALPFKLGIFRGATEAVGINCPWG